MVYIDSNIFIYSLGNTDKKTKACIEILKKITKREISGYTSFLTWDEFFFVIRKQMEKDKAIAESWKFLKFPNLTFLEVNERTIFKAQQLIQKYNLKPRDAIHAASALVNGIKEIISDDSDFDKIKELKRIKI